MIQKSLLVIAVVVSATLLWNHEFRTTHPKPASEVKSLTASQTKGHGVVSETWGPYRGVVDEVHDGDTIYVKLDLGFEITVYSRVRVYGINAPELSTDAGKEARAFVQKLLPPGSAVQVASLKWDKYGGRVDGKITLPSGMDLGQVMLDTGHAVPYMVK